MTTTELIRLLKEHEFGGATGRARTVYISIGEEDAPHEMDIIDISTGDGLFTELFLTLKGEERKTGKWMAIGQKMKHGYEWMRCSECGIEEIDVPAARTKYCPHCGARMEE